ncbi:hypothetical protein NYE40_23835 [Paenibacillus sp. FSL W8-1187]|uniref:hypothetical protein n=1 Tax=Paenibacillus sp. FSL W8-1187 TaxID=2975339 RepID=UPI0030DC0CC7
MNTLTKNLINLLHETFSISELQGPLQQNVWVMAVAAVPFSEKHLDSPPTRKYMPTHTVRLVLRTTDEAGTNVYVDGTDLYVRMDNTTETAELVREDLWEEGSPIFHGGPVSDSLRWVRELAEPFYLQLEDPFLTPEQRIALNGHDENYLEPAPEQRDELNETKQLTGDDFGGLL